MDWFYIYGLQFMTVLAVAVVVLLVASLAVFALSLKSVEYGLCECNDSCVWEGFCERRFDVKENRIVRDWYASNPVYDGAALDKFAADIDSELRSRNGEGMAVVSETNAYLRLREAETEELVEALRWVEECVRGRI